MHNMNNSAIIESDNVDLYLHTPSQIFIIMLLIHSGTKPLFANFSLKNYMEWQKRDWEGARRVDKHNAKQFHELW